MSNVILCDVCDARISSFCHSFEIDRGAVTLNVFLPTVMPCKVSLFNEQRDFPDHICMRCLVKGILRENRRCRCGCMYSMHHGRDHPSSYCRECNATKCGAFEAEGEES